MPKTAKLNENWIQKGLEKLRAGYSNVIFFETDDPERYGQFLRFMRNHGPAREHTLYQFDRWRGLLVQDRQSNNFVPVGHSGSQGWRGSGSMTFDGSMREVSVALRRIEKEIKRGPCFFIIKDQECALEGNQDRDAMMVAALRSWAVSPSLRSSKSAVFCFTPEAGLIADAHTLQKTAVIPVGLAEDMERALIVQQVAMQISQVHETLPMVNRLVHSTAGLNLHQFRSVLMESYHRFGRIDVEWVASAKRQWMAREDMVEVMEPRNGFESIGGYAKLKEFVHKSILDVLREPERARRFGVPLPRGILLWGPPGTGKSMFSKALAAETRLPFVNLKTENLFSQFLGESGRRFARAIEIAEKNAPCIVFIDEIDRFGARKSSMNDGASEESRRVFNQILEWLGDPLRKSILVGTTNRPQDLDRALTRPGRLDYKIPILYPDAVARAEILRIHLGLTGFFSPIPIRSGQEGLLEDSLGRLVQSTENFSGAELEELAHRIRRSAFNRKAEHVEEGDFRAALQGFEFDAAERGREVEAYAHHAGKLSGAVGFRE